ncbi:MAG: CDP-alcohol phosphatidyltransferase family protein [Candidatus Aenigmarchaeota archaeon]|nr:CDP-alcohol phosphatidyltransferase family protein [Candidatus Aenigmarchaeota archaeon]
MISRYRKKNASHDRMLGRVFGRMPLSPNAWTVLSLAAVLPVVYFILQEQFAAAAAFLLVASLFDAVDGAVARARNAATKQGAYLDTIADRYVEFIAVIGLFFIPLPHVGIPAQAWVAAYVFGSMLTTYAKAAAKEKGLVRQEFAIGMLERPERMALLFLALLAGAASTLYLVYVIGIAAVMANATAFQRIRAALRS